MPLSDAEITKQVRQDFEDKLVFEKRLRRKIRKLNTTIVTKFQSDMLRGTVTSAAFFGSAMTEILADHYKSVSRRFEGRTLNRLFDGKITLDLAEKELLKNSISKFIKRNSINQSRIILDTTQKNMHTAAELAISETADQIERSINASAILSKKLRSRETGIASLETQTMAETTKSAEADIFSGKEPLTLQSPKEPVTKEWVTVGDERVRPAHVNADSQLQRIEDFFIVMGQQLRFPGDTSFGATVENVVNCRCSSVYST